MTQTTTVSAHPPRNVEQGRLRALLGGVFWLTAVVWLRPTPLQADWAVLLLLLSPLVLVPLGLDFVAESSHWWRLTCSLQFPSALLLGWAFTLPEGQAAAALCLPWLLTTGLLAILGLARMRQRGLLPLGKLAEDVALVYLAVGAGWAVIARGGVRPLGFEPVIVLLTAIHFHHAGFVLPLLTGLSARVRDDVLSRLAVVGVLAGVPLVATGITASQLGLGPVPETVAAGVLSLAGLLTATLHLRLAWDHRHQWSARCLWTIAGLSLVAGMLLSSLYGCRAYVLPGCLDIPWMRALHGSANALGFALLGMLGWSLSSFSRR